MYVKGMLHEATFLATCNAAKIALQVARKNSRARVTPPFCNCYCCVASCNKSRTTLYFWQRCETSCLRVTATATCNVILSEWANQNSSFARFRRLSASAILFVTVHVASCEKSCKRVTPPLQHERFFIRHRCVASCKKNCLVLHGLISYSMA